MKSKNGGAVASESYEAAQAAIQILHSGGNAIDAAIAASAVQGVTRPFSGGVGGGGFMHVYLAKEKRFLVIDHRVAASKNFGPDAFNDPQTGKIYPGSARRSSTMATAVPGAVKAWEEALEKYGTMSLKDVLQPAIEVAENGFKVNKNLVREISENRARFNLFTSTKELYLDKQGYPVKEGTVIKNPDFAKTYRLIAERGSKVFYEGEIADAIIETISHPPVVEEPNYLAVNEDWDFLNSGVIKGHLSLEDLQDYKPITRESMKVNYRGYDVYGSPPVSSGGVIIAMVLNILEGYDLANMSRSDALHYFIEACRLGYADGAAYIGDPNFTENPLKGLLSKEFAMERRTEISDDCAASSKVKAGNPWPYEGDENPANELSEHHMQEETERDKSTIHLSVSDEDGNIVSYTTTIVLIGGNGMVVPGYGFLLNNALFGLTSELDSTSLNYPKPSMRPLSSMSPTIVMKDGSPVLTIGAPGSGTILTTLLQAIINYIDFDMNLPEAIDAPRLCQMNMSSGQTSYEQIFKEKYIDDDSNDLLELLKKKNHTFKANEKEQGIGCITGLEFLDTGHVRAAAEPIRRGGGIGLVQFPKRKENASHTAE